MNQLVKACVIWACSVACVVAADQPEPKAPLPLSPSESVRELRLPEGFRIELVASEPLVVEPSCVVFDGRGRMFVSEIHGFNLEGEIDVKELNKSGKVDRTVRRIRWERVGGPIAEQAKRGQFGTVKLLVDSDGDGRMDKADVWADRLPPCYGMLPLRDGLVVVCAPDILFLADRDGDGKAEVRETLLTGFRREFIERGINNPRWGRFVVPVLRHPSSWGEPISASSQTGRPSSRSPEPSGLSAGE